MDEWRPAGYLEDANNIFDRGKDENERISSYLECIWNTIAVSFFLAHLLTDISCYLYLFAWRMRSMQSCIHQNLKFRCEYFRVRYNCRKIASGDC